MSVAKNVRAPAGTFPWIILSLLLGTFAIGCSVTNEIVPTPAPSSTTEVTATPQPSPTATATEPDVLFSYTSAVGLLNAAEYERAIARFTMVIRILPEFANAYRGRALAYYNQDLHDSALDDLNKAIELDYNFADAYRDRAVFYLNAGEPLKAAEDLTRALEIYQERELTEPSKIEDVERMLRSLRR